MTKEEYNILFHKVGLNRVAFKAVNDCDEEILVLVNAAIAAEREACAALCDDLDDDIIEGLAGWQYGIAIRERGAP